MNAATLWRRTMEMRTVSPTWTRRRGAMTRIKKYFGLLDLQALSPLPLRWVRELDFCNAGCKIMCVNKHIEPAPQPLVCWATLAS